MTGEDRDRGVEARLAEAVGTGEAIAVIYHGGSRPGSQRRIVPLMVSDSKVRALDVEAGCEKTFMISKLELAGERSAAPKWAPVPPRVEPHGIGEGLSQHLEALAAMGWQIEDRENEVALFLSYRNGKRTPPYVSIRENSEPNGHVFTITPRLDQLSDGHISVSISSEETAPARPWQVTTPGQTISYGSLGKAIQKFLELAQRLAIGPPGVLDELPWEDMPVSKQVRGRLRNLGVEVPLEMTRGEASALLARLDPKRNKQD